jgi:hypothetical protein
MKEIDTALDAALIEVARHRRIIHAPARIAHDILAGRTTELIILLITVLVTLFGMGSLSWAQEAISQEEPTPSSVDEIRTPLERSFEEKPVLAGLLPRLKEQLKDTPPFLRDTKVSLNLRTFYFYRDKYDSLSEAWTIGGALSYKSGWFLDHFGMGAVLYTSQPLHAPDDRDGTTLLKPGQEGYTVLGQLYIRVKLFEDNFINIYQYEYNTPYINKDDGRMTPNTFEGYTFQGAYGGKNGASKFTYGGGYIDKIKTRNSDRFVSMSDAAGADVSRGVFVGGGSFSYGGFRIGAINYYSNDIINIGYAEAKYTLHVTERLGLLFTAQFTDQRSTGNDLLNGSSFKTNQFGVKTDISYGGGLLTLGYTRDSEGADLLHPWSSYPGYTSAQVQFFNRAGEEAFISKVSYDFKGMSLEDVTAYALFVHGWGRVNPSTGEDVPDENEFDVDIQWRPQWKFLKGLWFRTRYAYVDQYEGPKNSIHDVRVIVNYDFPLL